MLFDPLSAALGAATGELVFSEIMLGQFGGLGELEKFLTLTIGIYVAGRLVKNPKSIKSVAIASILAVIIQQSLGCIVDILKVQFAVEDFEAVAGLPESVFFTEGFACLNDILFSGILLSLLPCMYLVPKLYGKIEPLLGVAPRDENTVVGDGEKMGIKTFVLCAIAFVVAIGGEFMAENGLAIIDWEAAWAGNSTAMILSGVIAVLVIVLAFLKIKNRRGSHVIEINHLSFTYPGAKQPTLKNIHLTIEKGDFVAIIGNNGCGKSTLCKTLNGLIPRFIMGELQGKLYFDGKDALTLDISEIAKKVGYVYQDFKIILCPTVYEDASFACMNYGLEIMKTML